MKLKSLLAALFLCLMVTGAMFWPGCKPVESEPIQSTWTISFTATADDSTFCDSTGSASYITMYYDTFALTEQNFLEAHSIPYTSLPPVWACGTSGSFTVTVPTMSNKTYHIAVKLGDDVFNWSGLSNNTTRQTADKIPPAAPKDVH